VRPCPGLPAPRGPRACANSVRPGRCDTARTAANLPAGAPSPRGNHRTTCNLAGSGAACGLQVQAVNNGLHNTAADHLAVRN
jgi:hypothetical protein